MSAWGECKERCESMRAVFPELEMVRGHVSLIYGSHQEPHWWLIGPEGEIIDPTVTPELVIDYLPHDESGPEPTGKCPNCGDYSYNGDYCCSDSCHNAYVSYLMNP
jgi:hypothetical protein